MLFIIYYLLLITIYIQYVKLMKLVYIIICFLKHLAV